jgi:hypothetical protein
VGRGERVRELVGARKKFNEILPNPVYKLETKEASKQKKSKEKNRIQKDGINSIPVLDLLTRPQVFPLPPPLSLRHLPLCALLPVMSPFP